MTDKQKLNMYNKSSKLCRICGAAILPEDLDKIELVKTRRKQILCYCKTCIRKEVKR